MTTIDQRTLLPIINRFVIAPDIAYNKRLTINNALAAVAGSKLTTIARQMYLELPTFDRENGYPADWYEALRLAAS